MPNQVNDAAGNTAMSDEEAIASKESMSRWYWWGIPTFFRCDWKERPEESDIALMGVPHSSGNGSTERDQHLAPRAVRHVSATYRRESHPWNLCRINDAGDVPLPEAIPHWLGNRRSAAHWASYAAKEGHVDTRLCTQLGIRSTEIAPGKRSSSDELGYQVIGMDEIEAIGTATVIDRVRSRIGDAPVYITFDVDALDPCDAPSAANLEPGFAGLRIGQAVRILRGLDGLDVVGGDVVCMMPRQDTMRT